MLNGKHTQMSQSIGIVSFYTLISRLLGLLRDCVMAWMFGATLIADAFYVAFRIPNLLRRLVAEGSLTVAFVPIYTGYLRKSRDDARVAASVVFTYLSLFLVTLVVLGIIFSPWIVKLIAWGFSATPEKFNLTVYFTRWMFPYIFFISLVALAMGMLNSMGHFAAPAASPIFLNVGIILGAVVLWRIFNIPAVGLSLGVLLGGIMQLLLQIPQLIKEGMLPKLNFNWRHPALKGLLLLMIPSAFGAAVYQLNVLVVTFFASFLPVGSVSYLWFADRVNEFPLGLFSISIATVTLPTLSEHAAAKDMASFRKTINFSLRLAFLIAIPSAVGMHLLSQPIVSMLFQRGQFSQAAATATAGALAIFAYQIPFVSGVRNLVPGFFALRDAKTPVMVAAIAIIVNVIAAFFLSKPMLHMGLALALVISSTANFVILFWLFRRKVGLIGGRKLAVSILKACFASGVMAAALLAVMRYTGPLITGRLWQRAGMLLALIVLSIVVFVAVIRLINPDEYRALAGLVGKRGRRAAVPPQTNGPAAPIAS